MTIHSTFSGTINNSIKIGKRGPVIARKDQKLQVTQADGETLTTIEVANPVKPTDTVNRQYLESVLPQIDTKITKTISSTPTIIDTVPSSIIAFKYKLFAQKNNKRYYSEINFLANGIDKPLFTEYSVMRFGGLTVLITVAKNVNGDTVVSAKTTELDVVLTVIRSVL